jgi:hypothetical protein
MTKSEFLTKTAPIQVTVGGVPQLLPPRKFGADKPEADRSDVLVAEPVDLGGTHHDVTPAVPQQTEHLAVRVPATDDPLGLPLLLGLEALATSQRLIDPVVAGIVIIVIQVIKVHVI